MLRIALLVIFIFVIARAFWRLVDGIVDGISQADRRRRGDVATRSVAMVRDPVCGTFVLPDRAVALVDGGERIYFCSDACRDTYIKRPSAGSGRSARAQGRTA